MGLLEQLEEIFKEEEEKNIQPVCLIKDHPHLQVLEKEMEDTAVAYKKEKEAFQQKWEKVQIDIWVKTKNYLAGAGLITDEELKTCGFKIDNGVLFKKEKETP